MFLHIACVTLTENCSYNYILSNSSHVCSFTVRLYAVFCRFEGLYFNIRFIEINNTIYMIAESERHKVYR